MNKENTFEIIENFKVAVDQKEILRLLGHTPENKKIKDSSRKLIEEMVELSFELTEPKGIYTIKKGKELQEECFFNSGEKVALGVSTIGEKLEKKVEDLSFRGELTRAVILDAVGSVAAESTAEYLNRIIVNKAKEKKLYHSTRFSPGYGGWKLEGQRLIFNLLPAERIGVSLNRFYMMTPKKSVSFAVNLSRNRFTGQNLSPCEICGLKECHFKKEK
jgi:hypothetical protein